MESKAQAVQLKLVFHHLLQHYNGHFLASKFYNDVPGASDASQQISTETTAASSATGDVNYHNDPNIFAYIFQKG